mmetsp:Transcript_44541/g.72506  ORF Transcript_44541/g.72506 Transcript_44541/m.72506 type:complete len:108 (+) Transcript_44541:356-679(+)
MKSGLWQGSERLVRSYQNQDVHYENALFEQIEDQMNKVEELLQQEKSVIGQNSSSALEPSQTLPIETISPPGVQSAAEFLRDTSAVWMPVLLERPLSVDSPKEDHDL